MRNATRSDEVRLTSSVEEIKDEEIEKEGGTTYLGVNMDFLKAFVRKEKIEKSMSTAEVVGSRVKKITAERKVALIDMIKEGSYNVDDSDAKYFGEPFAMVSHAWGTFRFESRSFFIFTFKTHLGSPFLDTLTCIEEYIDFKCSHNKDLDPSSIFLLFDIFIINQHQMALAGHSQDIYDGLVNTLSTMVKIGSEKEMLLAFDSWKAPMMLGRLWCLFEIAVATKNEIKIHGSLPKHQKREMYETMIEDLDRVKKIFTKIDVEHAKATVMSDREFILDVVKSLKLPQDRFERFEGFNKLLSQTLEKWLTNVNLTCMRLPSMRKMSVGEHAFRCASAVSEKLDSEEAILEALTLIKSRLGKVNVSAFHMCVTIAHADNLEKIILPSVREAYPQAVIHGLTSSAGVMTERGVCMNEDTKAALSIFAISDEFGEYKVVRGNKCDADAVRDAILDATKDIDHPPCLILSALSPGPGSEEKVLNGVKLAFKHTQVPAVVGGSSADNDLSGVWKQISTNSTSSEGYSLLLCWPTVDMYVRLVSLHNKTKNMGEITEVSGSRTIVKIDDKPAASVYNEWTEGSILESLGGERLEGNVLGASTCFPLGKFADNLKDTKPSLIHPANVYENGNIFVFADVRKGDRLICMNASKEQLIDSVEGVVSSGLKNSGFVDEKSVYGALVIYCGGMMMKIQKPGVCRVAESISKTLGSETPWTGSFTFGEQGPTPQKERVGKGLVRHESLVVDDDGTSRNVHGNLMFNMVLFGETSLS